MEKHDVHKYERIIFRRGNKMIPKGKVFYKCMLINCPHYLRAELVVGRLCICWRCGAAFQLTKSNLLKKPHCKACTKSPKESLESYAERNGLIREEPINA